MAYDLKVFVGAVPALAHFRSVLPAARFYTLTPESDLAVLPFDDVLQDGLHERFGTGDWPEGQGILLSTTDQMFAAECSQHGPLAYLQCDDGAAGEIQSAAMWQLGQVSIGPTTLDLGGPGSRRSIALRPVNVALRALGVVARPEADEFKVFGLADYASNAAIHARAFQVRV